MAAFTDPFAPLDQPGLADMETMPTQAADAGAGGCSMLPAPLPLPEVIRHPQDGSPAMLWAYRDPTGALLFVVARWDKPFGQKEVRPYCCGARGWWWKGPPDPRPLYGLDRLAMRPDAPVLVVEGEKTADAATLHFPNYVAVTWPGGSSAAGKVDWGPLRGRTVIVWPDADTPGRKAAADVMKAASAAGAGSVAVVEIPADWPKGWDLADFDDSTRPQPGVPCGNFTLSVLRDMLVQARAATQVTAPSLRGLATTDLFLPPNLNLGWFPLPWPDWIARAAEGAGAPPDYVACALLTVVGATIGNSRWGSPWEGWRHPSVINFACIGLPSTGKSPAIAVVADAASELAADLNDDFEERMRAWRTASQEAKERRGLWEADVKAAVKEGYPIPSEPQGAREPDKPRKRRLYTTDPTFEAARDLSRFNPRGLLLHRDELAGWIAGMDRYGGAAGTDRAFWLHTHDGGRWTSDRVKDGDEGCDVPHLTWGIIGGIQPDRLASVLLNGDDDGLSSRFLYTSPLPLMGVSDPPSGIGLPFLLKPMLLRLRELPMRDEAEPVVLPFTREAVAVFQNWRCAVKAKEADATGLYLSWLGKLPGMAGRLGVIFLHLEWLGHEADTPPPEAVDLDAISRAIDFLADYAVPMAQRAFGEAVMPEVERDARRLARWLLRQTPMAEILNARALRRMANGPGIPTAERMDAALVELAELGWVEMAPARGGGGKGRQRADWAVVSAIREAGS